MSRAHRSGSPARPLCLEELEPRLMLSGAAIDVLRPASPDLLSDPAGGGPEGVEGALQVAATSTTEIEPNPPHSPQDISAAFQAHGDTDVAAILGQITPVDDEDAFAFTAQAGEMIVVSVKATSGWLAPYLELYDGAGTLLKVNAEAGATYDARLIYVAPTAGTYVASVSDQYLDATGSYELTVVRTDPTDLTSQIVPVGDGYQCVVAAAISPGGDWDYYTFQAPAGRVLRVDVTTPTSALDALVEVFNPNGWWIAGNDDRAPGNVDPYVETVIISPGYYSVLVQGFDAEEVGAYQMVLRYESPPTLTYNLAGVAAVTGSITEDVGARIYSLGTLSAGTPLHVSVTAAAGGPDTIVGLYTSNGTSLVIADDYGTSLNPNFRTTVRATDSYFLVVDAVFGDTGAFALTVDLDPPGPLPATQQQVVFVDVDGRINTFEGPLGPFDGADVGFPGQTQTLVDGVMAVLTSLYAPYRVTFVAAEPVGGAYSVLVLTGDDGYDLLGIAESVDPTNANLSETAIVYGGTFANLLPCTLDEMAIALGNVAAHELGHILGLSHVASHERVMDNMARINVLTVPQIFGLGDISYGTLLQQDSQAVLKHILGPWGPVEQGSPFEFTDASGDLVRVELLGPGQFVLVTADGFLPQDGEDASAAWFTGNYGPASQVVLTDLNPGAGGDAVFLDRLTAGAAFGGVVGETLHLGAFVGASPAAGGAGLQVASLGTLALSGPLVGAVIAGEITGAVTLPSVAATGLLAVHNDLQGPLVVSGSLAGAIDIGGNGPGQFAVGGHVTATASVLVGGNLGTWGISRDFAGSAAIGGDAAAINLRNLLAGAAIEVGGALGSGRVKGELAGALEIDSLTGSFRVEGPTTGTLHVTGAMTGSITLVDDLRGALLIDGDSPGTIWLGDDLDTFATLVVAGSAGTLHVTDDLRGTVEIGGNLSRLAVGDQITATGAVAVGGTLTDAVLGGTLRGALSAGAIDGSVALAKSLVGSLTVAGPVTGSIAIGRDVVGALTLGGVSPGTVSIGDDIEWGAAVDLGPSLAEFRVADDVKFGFTGGDLGFLKVGDIIARAAVITLTGDLGTVTVGGRLNGTLQAERLTGSLSVGKWRRLDDSLNGTVRLTSTDPCDADVTIGWDFRGTLDVAGPYTGVIRIGDDLETGARLLVGGPGSDFELRVTDDLKTGFSVDGGIAVLEVGDVFWTAALVTVTGDLGTVAVGRRLNGTLQAERLTGSLSVGKWRRLDDSLNGTVRLTSTDPCDADVTIGWDFRGTLDVAGPYTGVIRVGDDLETGARLLVGGPGSDFELRVTDDLKTGFSVDGGIAVLEVGDVFWTAALVTVTGDLGTVAVGRRLNGRLSAEHLTGSLTTGGSLNGAFTLTAAEACSADITIGGNLRGRVDLAGDHTGSLQVGNDITTRGVLDIGGAAHALLVVDQIRGHVTVVGGLDILQVGIGGLGEYAVVQIGGDLGGATIGGHQAGVLHVGGQLTGDLTVAGHLQWDGLTTIAGGLAEGAALTIGADVRHDLVLGAVLGTIHIGDDLLGDLLVSGAFGQATGGGLLTIADDATGLIDLDGDIYGDIIVGDYLRRLNSHGRAEPADPGLAPIDYVFLVAGQPEGTLTVGGAIGQVL